MTSITGRSGRRRRVLNEDVLAASSSHVALRAAAKQEARPADARRYSDAAGVDNHPLVTDFVPRRASSIAILVLGGTALTALMGCLHYFSSAIARTLELGSTVPLEWSAAGSAATWLASVLLLFTGVACAIVLSIRKHRIDDFRGRYRIWRWSSLACILASANAVAGFHALFAEMLGHFVGWTALRGGAIWWIILAGILLSWIVARTLVDVRECRLSAALLLAAIVAYGTGLVSFLGGLPANFRWSEPLVTGGARLLGHWLLLSAIVAYARFVVLDAQGLISARRRPQREDVNERRETDAQAARTILSIAQPEKPTSRANEAKPAQTAAAAVTASRANPQILSIKSSPALGQWVDGRRPERRRFDDGDDSDDDDADAGDHKLSKAERKRLRKLKAQRRAA